MTRYQMIWLSMLFIVSATFTSLQYGLCWDLNLLYSITSNQLAFFLAAASCYLYFTLRFNLKLSSSLFILLLHYLCVLLILFSYLQIPIQEKTLVYSIFSVIYTLYQTILYFHYIRENFLQLYLQDTLHVIKLSQAEINRSVFVCTTMILNISGIIYYVGEPFAKYLFVILIVTALFNLYSIVYMLPQLILSLRLTQQDFLKKGLSN